MAPPTATPLPPTSRTGRTAVARRWRVPLALKLLLAAEFALVLAIVFMIVPVRDRMREQVVGDVQNQLSAVAATAALQLDGDTLAVIRRPDQARSPAFLRLRNTLAAVRDVNGLRPEEIYTFYRDPDDRSLVRFGVMTHDRPFIGDPYPLRPLMLPVFEGGAQAVSGLYDDEYGQWISAYAPVRDSAGSVVSLLAVDRPARAYLAAADRVAWLTAGIGGVALLASSGLGWLLLNRTIVRPVRAVSEGVAALGRQDFGHRVSLRTRDELEDLGEALNHVAGELHAARSVQQGFLPTGPPDRHAGYELAVLAEPCEAAAGDYVDAFRLDDRTTAVLIADVSGHGLGPALLMSACRSTVRALGTAELPPSEVVARLDALLAGDLESAGGHFITLIYGTLTDDGTFTFCNAGHGPALSVTRGAGTTGADAGDGGLSGTVEVRDLAAHRPPVGVGFEPSLFAGEAAQTVVALSPGDRVLLATDGLTESAGADGEQFGNDRVRAIVADLSLSAGQVVERLRRDLVAHESHPPGRHRKDDLTILCVDRTGATPAPPTGPETADPDPAGPAAAT